MTRTFGRRGAGSLLAVAVASLAVTGSARATLIGPTPYLQTSNSPFAAEILSGAVLLETFEGDTAFNVAGATVTGGPSVIAPSGITDSVEADDGSLTNGGNGGSSLFGNTMRFRFTTQPLPTAAGIVWTDGTNNIRFEAFDQNGTSLGVLTGGHADASINGTTAEDRFYGVTHAAGIFEMQISNGGAVGSGDLLEVDHLQFGQAVPEPGSAALALCGVAAASCARFRRRRRRHP